MVLMDSLKYLRGGVGEGFTGYDADEWLGVGGGGGDDGFEDLHRSCLGNIQREAVPLH